MTIKGHNDLRHCIMVFLITLQLFYPDYDECEVNNGGCSQVCRNTIPGHQCSCNELHSLDNDNTTCVPNANCTNGVCSCLKGFTDVSSSESGSGSGSNGNCTGNDSGL